VGRGMSMRIQSRHPTADHELDAYMSPPCAVRSLIMLEGERIPRVLWEPCCGDGTGMAIPLREAGYIVETSDIEDYGFLRTWSGNILDDRFPPGVEGVITNPPFTLALDFIKAALARVPYSAWLLRTNFLESTGRLPFFRSNPPARVLISSRRLPMMHRYGWEGPRAPSNTCYAWFVWDAAAEGKGRLLWFDWEEWQW